MAAGWIVDAVAVLALALLCGGWVAVQAWVARRDPCQPGVEGNCGCKGWKSAEDGASCKREGAPGEATLVLFPDRR